MLNDIRSIPLREASNPVYRDAVRAYAMADERPTLVRRRLLALITPTTKPE